MPCRIGCSRTSRLSHNLSTSLLAGLLAGWLQEDDKWAAHANPKAKRDTKKEDLVRAADLAAPAWHPAGPFFAGRMLRLELWEDIVPARPSLALIASSALLPPAMWCARCAVSAALCRSGSVRRLPRRKQRPKSWQPRRRRPWRLQQPRRGQPSPRRQRCGGGAAPLPAAAAAVGPSLVAASAAFAAPSCGH
jgi:hypothetical protein